MAGIHVTDIEAAINWWRVKKPSPDGVSACAEVRALAHDESTAKNARPMMPEAASVA